MIRLEAFGAQALLITLAESPDDTLPLRIAQLAERARCELGALLTDCVPGWTTLVLHYDVRRIDLALLRTRVQALLADWPGVAVAEASGRVHEIAVWYAGEDLAEVARQCGLTPTQVIDLHAGRDYRVGAIGFAPGFAYLGELDERLTLPRRSTPRTLVPAGSLAIAERQTAIYPQASPGGWHLLGRTAQRLFDPRREPPCPLAVGDRVRFVPVDEVAYRAAGGGT
ncbi:5-oxoprolinase subunit PxpB [Pseudomonas sp. ZM23]|uniref:5-oxoprolinase subunit PxpB n=1 Tax=Pseudomonas triclosanedens TaxID=2961893 RepID=A0ABY7A0C1_9PSED|nr:5-oxoprolinase subunit PxpB [Pseudomonas triclosanedens]MCP8463802.1 5-oxoprolinase subunit PxpB [Pseudomonas triclosanedens]MCP8468886.1 5-oxoprolinase subunit PxpB [Pseudomonas triclosanedens]MCP8475608.1 5-oxoprolinase subunit PxpB [Pseudomonas triclosanedens]WAI50674.1 5-oxoprolinase subunit PxpB [Pseudomonas triclosanedens]